MNKINTIKLENNKKTMNKIIKASLTLSFIFSISLFSCSFPTRLDDPTLPKNSYIFDIGKGQKGATLSFSLKPKAGFDTKANVNGTPSKSSANVDRYLVYLIKPAVAFASGGAYPDGGDPLNELVTGGGPFTISNGGATSATVTFINVPPSNPDFYYIAVRAIDTGSVDLIKPNDGRGSAWGTTTQGITNRLAVSTSGVSVNASYQVSTTTNFAVNPNLQDGIGAGIETVVVSNPGAELSPVAGENFAYTYNISNTAGTGNQGSSVDGGVAGASLLNQPTGIFTDTLGNIYFGDSGNRKILKINIGDNTISTFAGSGTLCSPSTAACGDGSNAITALFGTIKNVTIDSLGNVYLADSAINRIRKINASNNQINTIAGDGTAGFGGDGTTNSVLNAPSGVSVDATGNVYIADTGNNRIRKVDTSGFISTIAGNGTASFGGDGGLATNAQINAPTDVDVDSAGNIYFTDTGNHRIRKIDLAGNISTVAGTGTASYSGDGGLATSATLNTPSGIDLDNVGNVYFSDKLNHVIRKVDTFTNRISTIAGDNTICSPHTNTCGDGGVASLAKFDSPFDIYIDSSGIIYVSDTNDERIRKLF